MITKELPSEYLMKHIQPWADTLLKRCLDLQPLESLGILTPIEALPLANAVYANALALGAHVELLIQPPEIKEFFLQHADNQQLTRTPMLWSHLVQHVDAYLVISTASNTRALSDIPSERHTLYGKGYKPILDTVLQRSANNELRWCLTQYPTPALAQEANMSTISYYKMSIEAAFLDTPDPIAAWKKQEEWQNKLIEIVSKGKIIRFVNDEGTDLEVDIASMKWISCAASCNFPDGEIFTGPNLSGFGVRGHVNVTFPTIYKNVEVSGIRLEFIDGKVQTVDSTTNTDFLKAMIFQDQGASYVGEIAIGTNNSIQVGSKNILFDEKIGGTFHFALGQGYPETGNTNNSQLHWDMVTDLRKSGKIYLDGICIFDKGTYIF